MTRLRLALNVLVACCFIWRPLGEGQVGAQRPVDTSLHKALLAGYGFETNQTEGRSDRLSGYAGDSACEACHRYEVSTYQRTAHFLTSRPGDERSILGSFNEGFNRLKISEPAPVIGDPGLSYKMEFTDGGFYMTALTGFPGKMQTRTERMDVVIGSGVRGQSYLYWRSDDLFELPVSYWSKGHQWINSPGYRNGPPNFDRPVSPRCLECHVTLIDPRSDSGVAPNRYDRASLVYGITCEKCHGPAEEHVTIHSAKNAGSVPAAKQAILNPAHFSRDQQVDLCALCHSGASRTMKETAFSYRPGESLSSYLGPDTTQTDLHPDVHANQVGLLMRSRCYLSSAKMTCSTCHQVHAPERTAASYSVQCLRCHRVESCGEEKKLGPKIAGNCIDCHMPIEQTDAIFSETADKVLRTTMRTHWIKVYPSQEMMF